MNRKVGHNFWCDISEKLDFNDKMERKVNGIKFEEIIDVIKLKCSNKIKNFKLKCSKKLKV